MPKPNRWIRHQVDEALEDFYRDKMVDPKNDEEHLSEEEERDIRESDELSRYEDRARWNAFFDALENALTPTSATPTSTFSKKPTTQPKPQPKPMPTTTKTPPSPAALAMRKHILTNLRQGIPPDKAPQLSSEQLLSRYGENTNTPFGRIRQTLNATFEGEALSVATKAVNEYAANPHLYAQHSLSVADLVQSCLYDINASVGLPKSARQAIDNEQPAIAVVRSVGL